MSEEKSILDRRSTRLSMSIPVNISGVDATGQTFKESVRTVIINKHGGKIATTRPLAMGGGVLIENHAVHVSAKASVVWLGEERPAGEVRHVGLQLLEAQNIWGIAFPPDDWVAEQGDELRARPRPVSNNGSSPAHAPGQGIPTSAGDEVSMQSLRKLQENTTACFQDFQNRFKQLTQGLSAELESGLRHRASQASDRQMTAVEEQIRIMRQGLDAAKDEIGKLEALVRELKSDLHAKR